MDIIAQNAFNTQDFLADIWGMCGDVSCYLWTKAGEKTQSHWFSPHETEQAAALAAQEARRADVYFGICPASRKGTQTTRAKNDNVAAAPCVWADIDIQTDGHHASAKKYSKSIDPWREKVFSLFPPSYLVETGGGYHAYWILKEPIQITDDNRAQIQAALKAFQANIQRMAGFTIDSTADLARVLRVPGTLNHKNHGTLKPVRIIEKTEARYALDELPIEEAMDEPPRDDNEDAVLGWNATIIAGDGAEPKNERKGLTPLQKCQRGASSAKFNRIYNGDISDYPSLSEAVQAMANIAAPRCDNDFSVMLDIFKGSRLWGAITDKHGQGEKAEKWLRRSFDKAQDCKRNPARADPTETGEEPERKDPEIFRIRYPDWRLNWRDKAVPIPNSSRNVGIVLACAGITARMNMLKKQIEFDGGLGEGFPSLTGASLEAAADYIRVLCQKNGLPIGRADCEGALKTIAEQNRYNPVQDWLIEAKAKYNGGDYITETFNRLYLSEGQNESFCRTLFLNWFISCAKLAFNDGSYSAPGMLILSGRQGCGKTRFVLSLAPDNTWIGDGLAIDPKDKDSVLNATRFWIAELGEIGQTLRKERRDRLKAFFTSPTDVIRKPYGRTADELPRQTAFIGTVNETPDDGFLNDPTGGRRYWPISVERVAPPANEFDCQQLWGQIMHLADYENGHLTPEETAMLTKHNLPHDKKTPEEIALLDSLDWEAPEETWVFMTATQLVESLKLRVERVQYVGRALRHISETEARVQVPKNNRDRRYKVPPVRDAIKDMFNVLPAPSNRFNVLTGGRQ